MQKTAWTFAAILGTLGIILGAFGAHALKAHFPPETMTSFETGVRYQMYHAFFLLFLGWRLGQFPDSKLLRASAITTMIGVLFFSGSIYLLTLLKLTVVGPVTPIGGTLLIAAWILLAIHFLKPSPNV